MPPEVENCVKTLIKKGYSKDKAWAICQAQYNKTHKKKNKGKKKCKKPGGKKK